MPEIKNIIPILVIEDEQFIEEKLKLVTDFAHVGVWDLDSEASTLRLNHEATIILTSKADQEPNIDAFQKSLRNVLRAQEDDSFTEIEFQFCNLDQNHNPKFISAKAITKRDPNTKKVTNYIGIMQDISDFKRTELELIAANKELEGYTSLVAHDLKAPLRNLLSLVDIMEADYEMMAKDEGVVELINDIRKSSQRMSGLVSELLTYSRIGRVHNEKTEVLLSDLIEDFKIIKRKEINTAKARINIDNDAILCIDRSIISKSLNALLSNAIKYRDPDRECVINTGYNETDESISFYVKDNGIGIEEKHLDQIFQLCSRLHKQEQNSYGIGLAIVKRAMDAVDGRIKVDSSPGVGTTFTLIVPKNY